jgi:mannitol 2-dehydrogenase
MLTATAAAARQSPSVWLEMQQIYGDLGQHARFADAFAKWLKHIYENGVESAIQLYVEQN